MLDMHTIVISSTKLYMILYWLYLLETFWLLDMYCWYSFAVLMQYNSTIYMWLHTTACPVNTLWAQTFCADWPGLCHHGGGLVQQLGLMVCVEGSGVGHVVQDIAAYQPIPERGVTWSSTSSVPPIVHFYIKRCTHAHTHRMTIYQSWRGNVLTHLSATARSLSGLKVPSVSMYMALPSPPPWSMGSCGQKGQCNPLSAGTSLELSVLTNNQNQYKWNFIPVWTLPDRWRRVCGTAGSSPSGTPQTSLWWSPSRSHLQEEPQVKWNKLIVPPICHLYLHMTIISYAGANNRRDVRTLQEFVQLLGACGDLDDLCSPLVELSSCGETHGHKFGSFSLRGKGKEKDSCYWSTRYRTLYMPGRET